MSEEAKIVRSFCDDKDKDLIVDKCEEAVSRLIEKDPMTGLFCVVEVLEAESISDFNSKSDTNTNSDHIRALLLLEFMIAQGSPSPNAMATVYKKVFPKLELSKDPGVAIKAKKINAILEALKIES